MDSDAAITVLKKVASHDAAIFSRRIDIHWVSPVVEMLRDLHASGLKAVLFGGCVRSMVWSRLTKGRPGRPRDIDIVVDVESINKLRKDYAEFITRETRFGGLQLHRRGWGFDVWPLNKTNAFTEDGIRNPAFSDLPATTFLNLEAVAVDLWPMPGRERRVYSGSDIFFKGMLSRTIEINRESNPFPLLCVVRALVFASQIDFYIGPRLADYIIKHGSDAAEHSLAEVQLKHYGYIRKASKLLHEWIRHIRNSQNGGEASSIRLPIPRQLTLFPESELENSIQRLQSLVGKRAKAELSTS